MGFQAEFKSILPKSTFTGILNFTEKIGDKETGKLLAMSNLNRHETRSGKFCMILNKEPHYSEVDSRSA